MHAVADGFSMMAADLGVWREFVVNARKTTFRSNCSGERRNIRQHR